MASPIEIFWALWDPIYFLLYVATYIPSTIYKLIVTLQFRSLVSPSLFKDAWFAVFWKTFGPQSREHATPRARPLIALASGVVLDIGPGSGEWLGCFDKSKVTKIYGVEPNKDQHALLKQRVKESGLDDVYVICPVGVEELSESTGKAWEVQKESVDCVVTVQCLCSIPRPKQMMGELYGFLKEGGRWILYEHVVVFEHQGRFMSWYQAAIDMVWPTFLGGCSITRHTGQWLKECGSWSKVDLKQPEDEVPLKYQCVPHLMGVLTK